MIDPLWPRVARRWLAKAISELAWEEVLTPENGRLRLASGIEYRFRGVRRIWDNLDIDPASLARGGGGLCPFQFVIDARKELGMLPAAEAMFLRELSTTLTRDLAIARSWGRLTADELIELPGDALHAALEGHPKAVANKGRLGWGEEDHARHAPEAQAPIRLEWLAVDRRDAVIGRSEAWSEAALLAAVLGPEAAAHLREAAGSGCVPVPVHPWQWDSVLAQTLCGALATGRIRHLGRHGPDFLATPSLRTLTPRDGGTFEVKLALGVLNTSAWRGIPGKFIAESGAISDWLTRIIADDPVLAPRVTVQREVLGIWYRDPIFAQSPEAPYRWHESLGAIWRERPQVSSAEDRVVLAAALFHTGCDGVPLAAAFARRADVALEDWLAQLFEATVVPLWHLMARFGLGFIAHGQNIGVRLRGGLPVGLVLKDFQGDLDLVDRDFPENTGLPASARAVLPRKPPEYIVHDIQTAHFVTVLRFLSAALDRSGTIDERTFYGILRRVLSRHRASWPALEPRFALFELFAPTMPRVCINRVRFAIGYEDTAARPLPALGTELKNPLALVDSGC